METSNVRVQGHRTRELPAAVKAALPKSGFLSYQLGLEEQPRPRLFDCGGVVIVAYERYFIRIQSTLMLTIVFSFQPEDSCSITLIAGGGKQGILMTDWGAEGSELQRGMGIVQEQARSLGMQVLT